MDTDAFGVSTADVIARPQRYGSNADQPCALPVAPRIARTATLHLRILGTTDLHGHLRGYDYATDRPSADTGLARIATLIRQARTEAPNTLLFDNGDFLQGTQLVDFWARGRVFAPSDIHPMIAAMNALRYDAGTLGNHEFDFGLEYLARVLRDADFPVVSTNLARSGMTPGAVVSEAILERVFADDSGAPHRLRVGVIGLLPPQTAWIGQAGRMAPIGGRDMVEAALDAVPRLRAQGADIVIALAHTGIEPASPKMTPRSENTALEIAAVPGIDALVCGHSHLSFPDIGATGLPAAGIDRASGTIGGKPAVMPGRWGSHLGVIDLDLSLSRDGWRTERARGHLRPVACRIGPRQVVSLASEDPEIDVLSAASHSDLVAALSRPIGSTDRPLQSFFAMVAPDAILDLIADVQRAHVARQIEGTAEAALPLLSAVSPGKTGGRGGPGFFIDMPKGALTLRHILDLYGYPNLASALRLSGQEISDWLEYAATAFNRVAPGTQDAPLLNPAFPGYNFDVITGLCYEIDLSVPPRFAPDGSVAHPASQRIRNLCYHGRPVAPDQQFIVATNTFRSSGMGPFPRPSAAAPNLGEPPDMRRLLLRAVESVDEIRPRPRRHWRFTPLPGTRVWFDTSPAASGRLAEADAMLEDAGVSPQGFLRLSLHL